MGGKHDALLRCDQSRGWDLGESQLNTEVGSELKVAE